MKYNRTILEPIVTLSTSYSEVFRRIGLKQAGGTHSHLKQIIADFEISTDHFLGQASNTGKEFKPFETLTAKSAIRKRLVKERGRQCEICSNTQWLGTPIALEVHHKDGNKTNNSRLNLSLCCPNCHSMTTSWRRTKK